ncbi:YesL family protein [Tessaracoccus sp. OS52]|uniref:YesL family protein n=1 Tax=Tessaracoccus sp. OS52 TaxID=2886691 RepID=UPI001D0FA493|nr:YesL family protein [Tessaracoccus sp. OS52]MCC2594568.1 YesL family protein [Tessaracoccus sp. OS52]
MRVDPGGRTMQGVSTLLAFVALNLIYLLCCVPLVTIGAATSALYEVTLRYADEERGYLIKDYFVALRRNFLAATGIFLALLAAVLVLAWVGVFWLAVDSPVSLAAAILAFLAAAYLLASLLYGLALVAAFRNTFGQTLKNALLLPVVEPAHTLGILLLPITTLALVVIFPSFLFILVTIGFSIGSYATAFLFRRVFRRHQDDAAPSDSP